MGLSCRRDCEETNVNCGRSTQTTRAVLPFVPPSLEERLLYGVMFQIYGQIIIVRRSAIIRPLVVCLAFSAKHALRHNHLKCRRWIKESSRDTSLPLYTTNLRKGRFYRRYRKVNVHSHRKTSSHHRYRVSEEHHVRSST